MSVGVDDKRQAHSVDAALIALAQARDQIGFPDSRLQDDTSVGPELKVDTGSKMTRAGTSQSAFGTNPVESSKAAARGGLPMWGLLGFGALVPISVVILGWHLLYRRADLAPISTSSVPTDVSAKSVNASSTSSRVAPQKDKALASIESPRLDLDQSVATMAHRIADSQQEIEQLKARQAQILLDNSELDRRLKETRELVRNNSDLINDLKSTQAQITQENADLAAQVKTGQEQVSMLAVQLDIAQTQIAKGASQSKVSPDRNVRLVEQKQRSKPPIPRAARANDLAKQLAPKPRLRPARPQPQTEVPAEAQ